MIELRGVGILAGTCRLENLTMTIPCGAYAVLMGRSGIGKTTTLEAICGLRTIHSGSILLAGREVQNLTPGERNLGYVPQDLGLFPTMTVRQHLEFSLLLRRVPRPIIESRVRELAEILGLSSLLHRGVQHLSGGESQRVALGRAIAFQPRFLLLDEPLSALDEAARRSMQQLLLNLKRAGDTTILHVTHSREEAEHLADLRLTLEHGSIHSDTENNTPYRT